MRKRDLITKLSRLPRNSDLSILIGDQCIDIAGVVEVDTGFALKCWPADVNDVLASEWGIPTKQAREIAFSQPDESQETDPLT